MRKPGNTIPFAFLLPCIFYVQHAAGTRISEYVATSYTEGDFTLVSENLTADVYVSPKESAAVLRCAGDFVQDVKRVTGKLPNLKNSTGALSPHAVIAGTLGKSTVIDQLVRSGKIDVSDVTGQWETFKIQVIDNPLPGVRVGLVIVGSDRRGTIYGLYDVSENIGVSPWYWLADVTPQYQAQLVVRAGTYKKGPPSVKYRGIFINDEVWGLRPWSQNRFPHDGVGVGPQAYRRIFELLLRLKANYIWPAMFSADLYWNNGWQMESTVCTRPFNSYEANKVVADEYAIVMGSSHCEPMLCNNYPNGEWKNEEYGEWNYVTNRDNIYRFWEERAIANGEYENIYTLGKRGQVDGAMKEGRTQAEKIRVMETILADQRTILKDHVHRDLTAVPQLLVFYREVLDLYDAGLKVPEDVTLGWVDDNHGYIRGLGRTGHSIAVLPTNHRAFRETSDILTHSPMVEYDVYVFTPGAFLIQVYAIPTQSVDRSKRMCYAIALDDGVPAVSDISGDWGTNVLRGTPIGSTKHTAVKPGPHVLRIWAVDPGIVLDKIVMYSGDVKDSYFGPPESVYYPAHGRR